MQFSYNSKKIEFYDESQARDSSGKWTGGGSSSPQAGSTAEARKNAKQTTTVYHGTSADVLKKIRENGLQPSKGGVYGRGVYATDNIEVALEYGAMKAPDSPKVGGKSFIGLIEVISSGFEEVSRYTDPTRKSKGDKKGDSIGILLNKGKVPPSAIRSMKLFDLKDVRSWIFEGGVRPKAVAERKLEEGTYYVPIVIQEDEITALEEKKCPLATQDIKLNLANRKKAIDTASYGPANPKEPNEEYWIARSKTFNNTPEEAKTMRCGNCAAFNKTSRMLACIKGGIGEDAEEVAKAGDLGFCEIFDFKCASLRTCDAWVVGGPIQDKDVKNFYDPSQERDESGKWSGSGSSSSSESVVENQIIQEKFSDSAIPFKPLDNEVQDGVKSENPASTGISGTGQCTQCSLDEYKKNGGDIYVGYTVEKSVWKDAIQKHDPKLWYGWNWQGEKGKDEKKHYALSPVVHAWNVIADKIVDRAIGSKEAKQTKYIGYKVPKKIADKITNPDDLFRWEKMKEDEKKFSYDPNQARDESGKWAGGGASAQGKFIEKIKKQNPAIDTASDVVRKSVDVVSKGVRGAKIAVQYGATKTVEITRWLGSSEGQDFIKATSENLRIIGSGAIGAIRGVNNARYKILVGGLINPALVPFLAGQAATRGMFDGIIKEYRGQGRGREISNKIREKIGVKPMQAFVQTIQMQVKQPPLEDVASYLADVLRVSIEEAIEGKERFEVVCFYDPSQDRDESGKWTGGGGGGGAKEPEEGMPIYDEDENKPISPIGDSDEELTQAEKIEKELSDPEKEYAQEFMQVLGPPTGAKNMEANNREYREDVVGWSKAFAEKGIDKEDSVQMAVSLHKYAGNAHAEVNETLRQMDSGYRGKDRSSEPNLEALGIAEAMEMAMDIAPKIRENTIWRGLKSGTENPIGQDRAHKLAKSVKVGQVIEDFGFSSFSLRESVGKQFSNWDEGRQGVQSKVLIKVKNASGVGVKMPSFASSFINEKEVLLRPETKLKVTSVKRERQKVNAIFRGETDFVYQTEVEAEIVK